MSEKNKICPNCGEAFACLGEEDCWCEKLQIHKREFLLMNQKYTDCLCPKCIEAYTEK